MSKRRTLKFRSYDTVKKEWLFGYEMPNLGGFSLIGEVTLMGELNSVKLEDWSHIDVMQFTGLLDKTGKEIFEGDILTGFSDFPKSYEIHFENGAFRVRYKLLCGNYYDWGYLHRMLEMPEIYAELIGNLHDNPDLL
jgi:hypothetical protein